MAMQDVLAEFDTLLLPDSRLVDRVRSVVERAWANPSASLPQMLQDTAQLEGAYRLLNNRRVDFEALLAPHAKCASKRAAKADVVVVAHDTTEVETAYAEPFEVGYLKTGRTGYLAHVSRWGLSGADLRVRMAYSA